MPPDPTSFDAVMLTSANAPRHAGPGLAAYADLPCYAVGETTAAAARQAGFADVRIGPADGAALLATMAGDGVKAAFHPGGRDRTALHRPGIAIAAIPVYAAEGVEQLPAEAEAALDRGALALLHSPRAAALFGSLAGDRRARIDLAAISRAAATAAGGGWRSVAVAARPRGEALLELAAKLCQTAQ
jgi:uroporphyrinogen-III synthase